ncbi:MAG TPA: TIGR02234 family membrane protein [Mycobacterium sp.]|nr:TIGR02234 family membrane protein [Mycobacterium sp.]
MAEATLRRPLRTAQLLLVLAALGLWVAARLPWVAITTSDGLGQPKTTTLTGGAWSTALLPLALLLLAAAIAGLAVRGWLLRLLAVLVALASAAAGYLAISQWVLPDVSARAADLAAVPAMFLVGSERRYAGAALTLAAAVAALLAAALLMRAAARARAGTDSSDGSEKYRRPAARRSAARSERATGTPDDAAAPGVSSERRMWEALDDGHDPTVDGPAPQTDPDAEGR